MPREATAKQVAAARGAGLMPQPAQGESVFDLIHEDFPPLRWLVDEMIPEGTVLVAGKPKSGKSWFVLNLILSAALDINFLKRRVAPCAGFYLALEDNRRRMKARVERTHAPVRRQIG